ncbi:MAG TPA: FKBP-type peptidyl-prolyl cis-trans isomerase, partial [Xanthomonadaceae bacterium]|nr:FKBP-type peptidyl-prolyl cis-trans isomerase [Xanthomonadaceae bacterium]
SACASAFAAPAAQPALTTDKDKVSYAIGMRMAAQLQEVKGDVDPTVLARALTTGLTGGKAQMTVPEAQAVLTEFGKKMQARQQAQQAQQAAAMAKLAPKNQAEGATFLAANAKKPGVKTTASGLQYQVVQAGNGAKPKATDSVKVNYTGSTLDGNVFDSSAKNGGPVVFQVNQVIPGWTEGLQLMAVGSKYTFWIPGNLAYGAKGAGNTIGPNALLKFDVELVSIGAK